MVCLFRLKRYKNFKEGQSRILVATDLVGRGIDIERVNIVINYDMPDSADTYLHRVLVSFEYFNMICIWLVSIVTSLELNFCPLYCLGLLFFTGGQGW
jgi:hypothetical protein